MQPIENIRSLPSKGCLAVQYAGCLRLLESESLEGDYLQGSRVSSPPCLQDKFLLISAVESCRGHLSSKKYGLQGVTAFDTSDAVEDDTVIAIASRLNRRDVCVTLFRFSQRPFDKGAMANSTKCVFKKAISQSLAIKVPGPPYKELSLHLAHQGRQASFAGLLC